MSDEQNFRLQAEIAARYLSFEETMDEVEGFHERAAESLKEIDALLESTKRNHDRSFRMLWGSFALLAIQIVQILRLLAK